jgi:hypothetical protein
MYQAESLITAPSAGHAHTEVVDKPRVHESGCKDDPRPRSRSQRQAPPSSSSLAGSCTSASHLSFARDFFVTLSTVFLCSPLYSSLSRITEKSCASPQGLESQHPHAVHPLSRLTVDRPRAHPPTHIAPEHYYAGQTPLSQV